MGHSDRLMNVRFLESNQAKPLGNQENRISAFNIFVAKQLLLKNYLIIYEPVI